MVIALLASIERRPIQEGHGKEEPSIGTPQPGLPQLRLD
jgi:hypothetical protein